MHPDDLPRYLEGFTKENVLREVRERGAFTLNYRLVIRDEQVPVALKIVPAPDKDGDFLIAGVRTRAERAKSRRAGVAACRSFCHAFLYFRGPSSPDFQCLRQRAV